MLNDIIDSLTHAADQTDDIGIKVVASILAIVAAWLVVKIMRKVLHKVIPNERIYFITQRIVFWVITLVTVLGVGTIWLNALNILVLTIAILAALGALAMKDLVLNIVGFGFVELKSPFAIGDRIRIGDVYGDIHDVNLLHFAVMEVGGHDGSQLHTRSQTGRIIFVPNRTLFEQPFVNETHDFPMIWLDLQLPIGHDSNLRKAKMILLDIAETQMNKLLADIDDEDRERWANNLEMFDESSTPSVSVEMDGEGMTLTLRFLCRYDEVATTRTRLWEAIHGRIMHVDDIDFAPPSLEVIRS